ncbi:MAG: hypothetical protein HYX89_03100 [Chloroflexi bacterium]|nr:hypothetical protein [Chloroflexota bacterium]
MTTEEKQEERRRRLRSMWSALLDCSPARLLPEETVSHLRGVEREMLLAFRSLLDAKMERLEKREREHRRPTEVPVE